MSAEIGLGTLSVRCKSADLELMLSSSIKCAPSREDEAEELQKRLTAPQLNHNSLSHPFLYCGSSLLLVVSLEINLALTIEQQDAAIERFSTQLRTAMLWHQLHFSAPSIRTSPTQDGRTMIEVTLTNTIESSDCAQRTHHKLGVDVPFHDIRPPSGVLAATLETVKLDLTIQHGNRPDCESAKTTRMATTLYSPPDQQSSLTHFSGESINCPSKSHHDASACELDSADDFLSPANSDDEDFTCLDFEMLLEAEDPDSRTMEHLLNLLDAAIRRAISVSCGPVSRAISVQSDDTFKPLGSVAPALFRQNHLPAVASRAVFLPTISKSISAIYSRRDKSGSPKRRDRRVVQLSTNDSSQKNPRSSVSQRSNHLPQLLWLTLDQGVLNANPERRLKPLSLRTGDSQYLGLHEQLLDDSNTINTDHQSNLEFGSSDNVADKIFEEDADSEYEDMLDDRDTFSGCGTDFCSEDEGGYDLAEELHWDYDHLSSDCSQDDEHHPSPPADDFHVVTTGSAVLSTPSGLAIGGASESIDGCRKANAWREHPIPTESIKDLASDDDGMLFI